MNRLEYDDGRYFANGMRVSWEVYTAAREQNIRLLDKQIVLAQRGIQKRLQIEVDRLRRIANAI